MPVELCFERETEREREGERRGCFLFWYHLVDVLVVSFAVCLLSSHLLVSGECFRRCGVVVRLRSCQLHATDRTGIRAFGPIGHA